MRGRVANPAGVEGVSCRAEAERRPERLFGGESGRILATSCVVMAFSFPGQTAGLSVFINPVLAALHVSRSALSAVYLAATLVGAAALTPIGRALDRFGIRAAATVIAVGFAAALVGFSAVGGLATVGLAFAGLRMLGQGGLTLAGSQAVTVSFDRRRGTAMGLASAAGNAGVALSPVAVSALIGLLGWRRSALVEAAAVVALVVPVARFGLPARSPGGSRSRAGEKKRSSPETHEHPQPRAYPTPPAAGSGLGEALRTPMFWAMAMALSATAMLVTGLSFNQISLLEHHGLSASAAAANFIPQTAATLAVSLLTGRLLDVLPGRAVMAGSMAALAVALLAATWSAPGWPALGYAIALGAANGGLRAQEATLLPRYYGLADLGAIRGAITTVSVAASAFGPLILAAGAAGFGSYDPLLLLLIALPVAAGVFLLVAPDPRHTSNPEGDSPLT
ncbi:MAG: MFS transporter [Actinomycetota bacterium]|nr:MFS transporter [Actinomycetota bacterium]